MSLNPNRSLDRYSAVRYGEDNFLPSFIFLLASCFSFVFVVARYAFELTTNHLLNNQIKSVPNLMTDLGWNVALHAGYNRQNPTQFSTYNGLFSSMLWTKLFCVVFLGLSCLGTKGVKEEKITWGMIYSAVAVGFVLFFLNWWVLFLPISAVGASSLYIFSLSLGYICLLMAGVWMSRLLKTFTGQQ